MVIRAVLRIPDRRYLETPIHLPFRVKDLAQTGANNPEMLLTPPHLVLLDIMLPGKDGLTIFKEIRTFSDIPVLFVTAKFHEIDGLLGLELGADDYIYKPFLFYFL